MLVNYYYVRIRTHDSKPWRQVIGIGLKKNDEKKPAGGRFFVSEAGKQLEPRLFLSFPPLQALLTYGFVQ
jgi:hypothetical protein